MCTFSNLKVVFFIKRSSLDGTDYSMTLFSRPSARSPVNNLRIKYVISRFMFGHIVVNWDRCEHVIKNRHYNSFIGA